MPNTKSAERRVRRNERRRLLNRGVKSNVKTVEKKFLALIEDKKHDEAGKELLAVYSVYDKAVKSGVIKRGTADRKKSRLSLRLNRSKSAPAK